MFSHPKISKLDDSRWINKQIRPFDVPIERKEKNSKCHIKQISPKTTTFMLTRCIDNSTYLSA